MNNDPRPEANSYKLPEIISDDRKRDSKKNIISTILILIAAPAIAFLLTAFVFQSYEVDGPSMESTLQNHDRLVVLKSGKTWSKITGKKYIPKRGEIIIFTLRGSSETGEGDRQLIKRVIGLPGDRIVVQDGFLTVYNKQHPDGFSPDKTGGYADTLASTTPGRVDITVKENEIFVCGDNRPNSLDSRIFGPISSDDVVGNLTLRIYPFSKFGAF